MIHRTAQASVSDCVRYFFWGGENPRDEWAFEVDGLRGRILNEWRCGATLFVHDTILAHSNKLFEVAGRKAVLSATATDSQGTARKIDVFVRAIVSVKIRVEVNGSPILKEFI